MATPVRFNHLSNEYELEQRLEGAIIIEKPIRLTSFTNPIPLHTIFIFCLLSLIIVSTIKFKPKSKLDK